MSQLTSPAPNPYSNPATAQANAIIAYDEWREKDFSPKCKPRNPYPPGENHDAWATEWAIEAESELQSSEAIRSVMVGYFNGFAADRGATFGELDANNDLVRMETRRYMTSLMSLAMSGKGVA